MVLQAGVLVATVLDTLYNGMDLAILDTSADCHMPDVLEMPYRPPMRDSGLPGEKAWTYRLGGPTCLAGDVIGDYSFDRKLEPGSRIVFEDMALYTMVKTNTFNGMPLPSIVYRDRHEKNILSEVSHMRTLNADYRRSCSKCTDLAEQLLQAFRTAGKRSRKFHRRMT